MNDLLVGEGIRGYSAKDIEVLEGLEPVRRRPGMYIGGTDETALHHLAAEILDNAMDEAVAGHASFIEVTLEGQPADDPRQRPRHPGRSASEIQELSALEVILTTLHSGGKFGGKAYATSGGLHGVGSSVVNALSESDSGRGRPRPLLWRQSYARGKPTRQAVKPGRCRTGAAPASASSRTPKFSERWGSSRRGSTGCAAPRLTCSAACRSAGL